MVTAMVKTAQASRKKAKAIVADEEMPVAEREDMPDGTPEITTANRSARLRLL